MTRRWSARSLASGWQHKIFYAFIGLFGCRGAYILLFFVICFYALNPAVRARSLPYLKRRFPQAGFWQLLLHTWKLQWNFGKCLVDRAAVGIQGASAPKAQNSAQPAPLEEAATIDPSVGLIFLAAHTGCWQTAPYALKAYSGRQICVLMYREQGDVDREVFEHQGKAPPFRMIWPEQGALASLELVGSLRRGQLLCMMGDRSFGDSRQDVEVVFFGQPVKMPCLAFRLASAAGVPVVFAFSRRVEAGQNRMQLGSPLPIPAGLGNRPTAYAPYVQQFATALENFVREHPYQFFNFYNVWE